MDRNTSKNTLPRKRKSSANRTPTKDSQSDSKETDQNKNDSKEDDNIKLKSIPHLTTANTTTSTSSIELQATAKPITFNPSLKKKPRNVDSNGHIEPCEPHNVDSVDYIEPCETHKVDSGDYIEPCETHNKSDDNAGTYPNPSDDNEARSVPHSQKPLRTDTVKSNSENVQGRHRTVLEEFADKVTMIGLARMANHEAGGCHRLVWCLVLAAALTFTGYQVVHCVCVYCGTPITVKVNLVRNGKLVFPAITLCSVEQFHANASPSVLNSMEDKWKNIFHLDPQDLHNDSRTSDHLKDLMLLTYLWRMSDGDHLKLLRCQWEQTTCTLANFTPIFTDMGLCYSFNVNGTFKAREAGRSYGLKLTLDTMQDDYLRSLDHYYGAGFRVVVHSSSVPPIMSEKGVAVSPGLHNFLAIDVKHLKNAKPSVSHCGSKALRYYRGTYSTEACRLECRADYINRSCGCRDTYMPNLHVRICDPPEFHSCIYPMMDEYLKQNTACEDLCPEPCSENLYQVTPSSNPFSQRFLQEFSQLTNKSADYWRQNLLHLEIYLTSMTYEKVEKQLSYTLLQLFCDVGGAFGLLLGASILTLLEIVDFFLCRLSTNSAARGGRGGGIGGGGGGVGGGIGGGGGSGEGRGRFWGLGRVRV